MGKIEELLVEKGLYDPVGINIDDYEEINKYLSDSIRKDNVIDCFCTKCAKARIFECFNGEAYKITNKLPFSINQIGGSPFKTTNTPKKSESELKAEREYRSYLNQRYALAYRCTRDHNHVILFDLLVTDSEIIKIGQFPSIADLLKPQIAKYKAVLGDQYHELTKAIGLFAHGIGIGSFVYVRRIIERLVFNKYEENADIIEVSREDFLRLKFEDKIALLGEFLPKILVENKNIYGIVSKGIHELDETECLNMFPCIRTGIELILDDILLEKERKEKEAVFSKFIEQKTGELRSRS